MSTGRFAAPGRTRSCPHCKATILDSATICPGCHHHLRFESGPTRAQSAERALRVDGVLRHPVQGEAWEYSVVLSIRNARGEELARQVVGVGALAAGDERTFSLAVEVFKPQAAAQSAETAQSASARDPAVASRPGSSSGRSGTADAPASGSGARSTAPSTRIRPRLGGR